MTRVVLCSPAYRGYGVQFVRGWSETLTMPEALLARLDAIGVECRGVALDAGYGGSRNMAAALQDAGDADLMLCVEADMAFRAEHVVRLLEAESWLRALHGGRPVAVGAAYPSSSDPRRLLLSLEPDRVAVDLWDPTTAERVASELDHAFRYRDDPRGGDPVPGHLPIRYRHAWMLPFGFVVFPVQATRDAPRIGEAHGWKIETKFWDQDVSAWWRQSGVPMFVDLAIDVGHQIMKPMTAREACGG